MTTSTSKRTRHESSIAGSWFFSIALHLALLAITAAVVFGEGLLTPKKNPPIEIRVIEQPKVTSQPLKLEKPPPPPPPQPKAEPRKVFGISKKTLTDDSKAATDASSVAVKAGNTTAVAPDDKKLLDSDLASLPIPTDEYLISRMPAIEREVKLPYPEDSRAKSIEGPVVLDILIDDKGVVRVATVISGPAEDLKEAARNAILQSRFRPAEVNGKPVSVKTRFTYRWKIDR